MDTQKLILDRLTTVLSETDKGNAAKLKALVDGAGRIFVGGAGRSGLGLATGYGSLRHGGASPKNFTPGNPGGSR